MKRVLVVLIVYVLCQGGALAQTFNVGDRVYVTTVKKFGTVVGGEARSATKNPCIRLDDAPGVTGGTIYDAAVVIRASEASPGIAGGGTQGQAGGFGSLGGSTQVGAPPISVEGASQQAAPATVSEPSIVDCELPRGVYVCSKTANGAGMMGFGSIEIKGRSYRGMDATIGPFIPFTVNGGIINFTGGLKGLEELKVTKTYISKNSDGQPIIVIRYSTIYRGFASTSGFECACQ